MQNMPAEVRLAKRGNQQARNRVRNIARHLAEKIPSEEQKLIAEWSLAEGKISDCWLSCEEKEDPSTVWCCLDEKRRKIFRRVEVEEHEKDFDVSCWKTENISTGLCLAQKRREKFRWLCVRGWKSREKASTTRTIVLLKNGKKCLAATKTFQQALVSCWKKKKGKCRRLCRLAENCAKGFDRSVLLKNGGKNDCRSVSRCKGGHIDVAQGWAQRLIMKKIQIQMPAEVIRLAKKGEQTIIETASEHRSTSCWKDPKRRAN